MDFITFEDSAIIVAEGLTSEATCASYKRFILQLYEVVPAVLACTSYVGQHKLTESLQIALRPAKSDELIQVVIVLEDLLNDFLAANFHDFGEKEESQRTF